eukprot:366403-Chlamydomonas_euryale.AAC.8
MSTAAARRVTAVSPPPLPAAASVGAMLTARLTARESPRPPPPPPCSARAESRATLDIRPDEASLPVWTEGVDDPLRLRVATKPARLAGRHPGCS